MKTHYQILIVGGGNAGISVAAQLLRKKGDLVIGIIDPSEKHYYQPAWTLVGGGVFDINKTVRKEKDVIPEKAVWIKDAIEKFQPESNSLTCKSGTSFTYDYLVVAPGIQLDWYKIKGLKENLGKNGVCSNYTFETAPYTFKTLQKMGAGKAIFTAPSTPIKCGGAPQKIMYLAADFLRKHGFLKQSEVHFYSGGSIIFGVKKYAEALNKVVARYGIETHFGHNLVEIDGDKKIAYFETKNGNDEVVRIAQEFDMIHATPPQSAPDFIKKSPLAVKDDPLGWVDLHKDTMQHNQFKNIFGCGDASSTPNSKTGAAIREQAPVLVKNLLSLMDGKQLAEKYNGYSSCPLVTGYGKLILAEFDYNNEPLETFPFDQGKERYSIWLLKTKVLPWLYWDKILKGTA
ncbi:FAD/NAD(P)-binding oxidoreductase [Mucilaginibacter sp. 10I4]|uniref:NAD(P)/FAD-dependent oxidoreductase n=1 Tax=Mucilaginibacter sp. 10I4 TaxID=3048580 RepID=UPI002B224596|nr:FAD/NAD(P)-binding oxidoreductase [Mucilaginibacter sp. 10I4]MEB0260715.1 FAD/NAD(P)-binding oxidoreductase [Mucilaginibacter sp. 10I4]